MLEHLAARVNGDANLVRRGKHVNTTFLIAIDNADHLVRVERRPHRLDHARPVHHAELFVRAARLARRMGEALVADTDSRLHRHLRAGEEEAVAHRGRSASRSCRTCFISRACSPPRGNRARRPHEPALRTRHRPLSASRPARRSRIASMSRRRAPAFRCSACTPPAPTAGSIAACSTIRASRRTIASSCSTCRGTANPRRPSAGRTRNTASPRATMCA